MSRKVVNVTWFNTIGIVSTVDDESGEHRVYVGAGRGFNENDDINHILNYGTKMLPVTAMSLSKHLNGEVDELV